MNLPIKNIFTFLILLLLFLTGCETKLENKRDREKILSSTKTPIGEIVQVSGDVTIRKIKKVIRGIKAECGIKLTEDHVVRTSKHSSAKILLYGSGNVIKLNADEAYSMKYQFVRRYVVYDCADVPHDEKSCKKGLSEMRSPYSRGHAFVNGEIVGVSFNKDKVIVKEYRCSIHGGDTQ